MSDDQFADRKKMTFAQAEGVEPLPAQLEAKEVSAELRAVLWRIVFESMRRACVYPKYVGGNALMGEPWVSILYDKHVHRDYGMADEFSDDFDELSGQVKRIFDSYDYIQIFDFLQWVLGHSKCPIRGSLIDHMLERCRAAYRLLDDGRTIVPISSVVERETLSRAFADLDASEFDGARAHLTAAAAHLTAGECADSIRESIHAVESVARVLGPSKSLKESLQILKKKHAIHPAMEAGMNSLYGYTSDENGVRHPLLDEGAANVDETDAIFMIGTCAAFVSYLINRSRA